ncbi:MAG: hypothetical protein HYT79_07615 [Elusimicrobia bacterium]|nr:hypothetical protein [Elusimicrobiota bacterium]
MKQVLVLCFFATAAVDLRAGYLDSRHWSDPWLSLKPRETAGPASLFGAHPAYRSCVNWRLSTGFLTQGARIIRARSKEPVAREFSWEEPLAPAVSIQRRLRQTPGLWLDLAFRENMLHRTVETRGLFKNGDGQGSMHYQDQMRGPMLRFGLRSSVLENRFWAGAHVIYGSLGRNFEVERREPDQSQAWLIRENLSAQALGAGIGFYGVLPKDWLWALAWDSPLRLKTSSHDVVYQSTQTAWASGRTPLASTVELPAHLSIGLAFTGGQGKRFWAEFHQIYFSRMKAGGRLVSDAGAGLLWDTALFQQQAMGLSSFEPPAYQDVRGLRFGLERALIARTELLFTGEFWTHYADPRVLTPIFWAGLGFEPKTGFDLRGGLRVSRQDYFGDGLFWPKDQRLNESILGLWAAFSTDF